MTAIGYHNANSSILYVQVAEFPDRNNILNKECTESAQKHIYAREHTATRYNETHRAFLQVCQSLKICRI